MYQIQNKIDKLILEEKIKESDRLLERKNNCVKLTEILKTLTQEPDNYKRCISRPYPNSPYCDSYFYDCDEFNNFQNQHNDTNNNFKIHVNHNTYKKLNFIETNISTNTNTVYYNLSYDPRK
jgi:hypothetical protein